MTLFLVANAALAWTGSDAYYDMSASNTADADAPTHSYIDISGTGTRLAVSDLDDGLSTLSGVLPPGTTFRFYDQTFTPDEMFVDSNGRIAFGAAPASDYQNPPNAVTDDITYAIHIVWEDLRPQSGGDIHAEVVGDELIVQFTNVQFYATGGAVNVQTGLDLVTGEIRISNGNPMIAQSDGGSFGNTLGPQQIGQGLSTPSGGLQAFNDFSPPSDVTYVFHPNWTCVGGDPDLCDAVDLAAAATPMIDEASPNVRLRPSAIYARLDAIRTFGTGAGCGFSGESWGGGYARGLAEGTTTTGGVVTGMFRLNDVEGDVDGTPFGAAYGAYGRGNVLASDGADFVTGMYVRTKGPHGVWVMLEGDTCNGLAVYGPTL